MNNTTAGKKALSMLGLAKKAGKVVSGESKTETAVMGGTACLELLQQTHQTIRKNSLKTKPPTVRFQFICLGRRRNLAMRLDRNSALLWQ